MLSVILAKMHFKCACLLSPFSLVNCCFGFCRWLEPDRTWAMHMCVCLSVIVTFVLILLGLASYNDLVSPLIVFIENQSVLVTRD